MKTRIRFKLSKGETKHLVIEKLASYMWKYFRTREIDGKQGIENTVENDKIRVIIDKYLLKNRLVSMHDKINIDRYQLFLERLTSYIMHKYLTNPDEGNPCFIPGLLNNPGNGYFLAKNHDEVKEIKKIKEFVIDGMEDKLKHRIIEADKQVELLTSSDKKNLLMDSREIA